MKDIILIPTYNERENIKILVPRIFSILPDVFIKVIDDNSPDGTAAAVEELMKSLSNLSILRRAKKEGLGEAYKDAIKRIVGDKSIRSITSMDADGSHDPSCLPEFFKNLSRYDVVIGSRYIKGGGVEKWELWRQFLSKSGNLYSQVLTGLSVRDLTAGFMCMRREILEKVDFSELGPAGYAYLIELKYYLIKKLEARFLEVPIIFKSRREGESKISHQIIREGLMTPLKIFLKRIWRR